MPAEGWKVAAVAGKALMKEAEEATPFVPTDRQQRFRDLVEAFQEAGFYDRTDWLRATRGLLPKTFPPDTEPPRWTGKEVTGKELGDWYRDVRFGPWLYANIMPIVEWDNSQYGMVTGLFMAKLVQAMQAGDSWAFPLWQRIMENKAKIDAATGGVKEGQGAIDEFMVAAKADGVWKVEA